MVKSVQVKNFKLHKDTSLEAARLNVFIGPNNSGKSSIFQALMALKQAAREAGRGGGGRQSFLTTATRIRSDLRFPLFTPPNMLIDLGNFDALLQDKLEGLTLGLSGTLTAPEPYALYNPIKIEFEIHVRNNQIESHTGKLGVGDAVMVWQFATSVRGQGPVHMRIGGVNFAFTPDDNFRLLVPAGADLAGAPVADQTKLSNFANYYLALAVVEFLESLHMVYPLRGLEEWGFPLPSHPGMDLEALTLEERVVATASLLAYESDRVDALSEHFQKLFGFRIRAQLLPGPRVTLQVRDARRREGDTLLSNEGTGATQLPFILVPMMLAAEGDSMVVCEPEAHLHPKAQSELMSLILRIAKSRNLQLFIETHSEHVLHKLLHSVAKEELAKDDLAIFYFENVEGAARVSRLEIDETGGVKGGLPGFFDQSLDELEEYLDALKGAKL